MIPAKPYVRLVYTPTTSQQECCDLVRRLANAEGAAAPDFVEATVFARDAAVVMSGRCV